VLRKVLHQPVTDLAIHHEVVSVRSAIIFDVMELGEIRVVEAAEPRREPLVPDDEIALNRIENLSVTSHGVYV